MQAGALVDVCMQHEAVLAADAATVIYTALTNVVQQSRHHSSSRTSAAVYTNTTQSIDCDAEPIQPWRHGYDVMKALREVTSFVV